MKSSRSIGICSLALAAAVLSSGCASDTHASENSGAPSEAEMVANWQAFMTPGPEHKVLDAAVGSWNTHTKFMMGADGPSEESDGSSEIDWVMGGRYIHETAHGTAMNQPFDGAGVVGFDNIKKKYVGGWIDSMGTGVTTYEGTYDPSKKTISYTSSGPDATVTKYVPTRMVETFVDADHFKLDFYMPDEHGKEFKSMELSYTRAR